MKSLNLDVTGLRLLANELIKLDDQEESAFSAEVNKLTSEIYFSEVENVNIDFLRGIAVACRIMITLIDTATGPKTMHMLNQGLLKAALYKFMEIDHE